MKTNELRIGNFISDGNFELEVVGISDGIISGRTMDRLEQTYQFNIENLIGISISEERLLKFGFEGLINEKSQCGNFYLNYDPEYSRHGMAIWHQKGSWCFNHTEQFTVLKYVHQLQNLYFALTGEELTIKS